MSNNTVEIDFAGHELGSPVFEEVAVTLWLVGIFSSTMCLMLQSFLFICIPQSRKFDEVIVSEMTIARIINTILEFYIIYYSANENYIVRVSAYLIYMHSDLVMLCFMFIFTKHLYNKIVVVFPMVTYNLSITSLITWLTPLPISFLGPILLEINSEYYSIFLNVYTHVKFFICILNALVFVEIIRVAFRRNTFLKTAIITFVLVTVTSLQVLVTDLVNYYYEYIRSRCLLLVFCVINSFQVLVLTGIFIILVKKKSNDSVLRRISIKLNYLKPSFV